MQDVRLRAIAALFLIGAIFVLPIRGLSTLRQIPSSASPLNQLSIRSATRLRAPGLVTPRLRASERVQASGRKAKRSPLPQSLVLAPAQPAPPRSASAGPEAKLALFPLRC